MNDQRVEDPARTLDEIGRLRSRTRQRVHGGAWVPAGILATLLLLSAALYRYPFSDAHSYSVFLPFWVGLPHEARSDTVAYAFWLLGLPAAFAVIAGWYRHRARRVGVRVPWPLFVGVGLGSLVLLLAMVAVPAEPVVEPDGLMAATDPRWLQGLGTPLLALAASVVALGWVERSPGLAVAGGWLGLLAWWQGAAGAVGALPGWLAWLLGGGEGPALGGQLAIGSGGMLLVMAAPLLGYVVVGALRARGGTR